MRGIVGQTFLSARVLRSVRADTNVCPDPAVCQGRQECLPHIAH